MNDKQRVVVLSTEQIEKLAAVCEQEEAGPARSSGIVPAILGEAGRQLRKALDQPKPQIEYRLAGEKEGETISLDSECSRKELEEAIGEFSDYENVRVQGRVLGPWVDVEQGGEQ